jgi:hypothetical protein
MPQIQIRRCREVQASRWDEAEFRWNEEISYAHEE